MLSSLDEDYVRINILPMIVRSIAQADERPMPDQRYRRPPITEAVIEVRFAEAVEDRELRNVSHAFASHYPGEQILLNVEFGLSVGDLVRSPTAQMKAGQQSYRRSTLSEAELALAAPASLIISQLPDYPGWQAFFDRFKRDWSLWKREVGYRKIVRVGVRYINRLDIPADGPVVAHERYLNLSARSPDDLGPTTTYAIQATFQSAQVNGSIVINSGVVPSPLEGRLSIMLDIDVSRENSLPQKDEDLLLLLQDFREEKNRVFEACITDRARELFDI